MADGRHKRVWKACERCRMKKIKCDSEFPCKRCKDDGLVCTATTRKKIGYKQSPKGYAEVLENSQFALIATVHKLYAMVRSGQPWELGEPGLNDRGQPVIHNIASKLGCIRPATDLDLPVHGMFPEDEAGLAELTAQLEAAQAQEKKVAARQPQQPQMQNSSYRMAAAKPDSDSADNHSHFEAAPDYCSAVFETSGHATVPSLSPQGLSYSDFEVGTPDDNASVPFGSPTLATSFPSGAWGSGGYMSIDLLNQGPLEPIFSTLKPHRLSCPNSEIMMGVADPMTGYSEESLRL